ncbi:MAG: hypothetical protein BBJ57_04290 [Desulfobacterales bacterium PC51MH44]|nr:MAG: hypothetical protein BBJ57_04290 [Desulfobacterales bacterium PC51MH44]
MKQKQINKKKQKMKQRTTPSFERYKEIDRDVEQSYPQRQGIIGNHGVLRRLEVEVMQKNLTVRSPNDRFEKEADQVAEQMVRMPASKLYHHAEPSEKILHAKDKHNPTRIITPKLEPSIIDIKGGSQPLPASTRAIFEPKFGYDFSGVRVHKNDKANDLAQTLDAQALTIGSDIIFGTGQYSTETTEGKRLLTHELTHVVQQGGAVPIMAQPEIEMTKFVDYNARESDHIPNDINRPVFGVLAGRRLCNMTGVKPFQIQLNETKTSKSLKERVELLEKESVWKEKRHKCEGYLDVAYHDLSISFLDWNTTALTLGAAYYNAYDKHKTAIEASSKEATLREAALFGILTAVTAGSLGWIGEAAELAKFGTQLKAFMTSGIGGALEDFVQTGIGEAIDVWQAAVAPTAQTLSKHPYIFKGNLMKGLNDQMKKVHIFFKIQKKELNKLDISAFETIMPEQLQANLDKFLKGNKLMKSPNIYNEMDMQNEIERGFWAIWAPHALVIKIPIDPSYSEVYPFKGVTSLGPRYRTSYKKPGAPVEKRLNRLGITEKAGIGKDWGWVTQTHEIVKFAKWGKEFPKKIKKFKF